MKLTPLATARKALEFYARHEHWMALTENSEDRTLLVAQQGDQDGSDGWLVAEAALKELSE